MFRQEKTFLPFNEISHLTGESLNFAINLRKKAADEKAKREAEKKAAARPPLISKLVTEEGKAVKDSFAVKETNCTNTQCLQNNYIYADEFQEVVNTSRYNMFLL